MKRVLLILMLCGLTIAAHAQGATMPTGLEWNALPAGEQVAYVQGFVDGQMEVLQFLQTDKMLACKPANREGCLILKWWASIKYVPDSVKIVATMNTFYSDARNLCIMQPTAFLITEAMAQGEPISDSDLAVIRLADVELVTKSHTNQP